MAESKIITKLRRWRNLAILRVLPPCKEIVQIVSASLDRRLTIREKFVMKVHLVACKPCVRYFEQSKFLNDATHQLDEKVKDDLYSGRLSDDARQRITEALKVSVEAFAFLMLPIIFIY